MNLGGAIVEMQKMGNQFASWYLIDTNIESIELLGNNTDGYKVEVKLKQRKESNMTIEYRAKQYAQHYADTSNTEQSQYTFGKVVGMQRGYVQGATDQQNIDIEKVYHALEKVLAKDLLDELVKTLKGE